MRANKIVGALAVALLIGPAVGQQPKPKPRWAETCDPDPKRHAAYSAEFLLTNVYPAPDGSLVTYNYFQANAFDSHGRSLISTTSPDPKGQGPPQTIALVCDPTTNTQYRWDSLRKSLLVLKMPRLEEHHGCWESEQGDFFIDFDLARRLISQQDAINRRIEEEARNPNHPDPLIEDLGTMMLEGVEVQGTRTTSPAKSSTQEEPAYETEEHWASPLLGTWLQQQVDYSRSPKHNIQWSRRVTNLSLNEPDPSTFDPPRDYKAVTEFMHPVSCESLGGREAPRVSAKSP